MPTHQNDDSEQALLEELGICQPTTDEHNLNEDDDDDQQPQTKKQKIECSIPNCTNSAQSGGICIKHGGRYLRRYYCSIEGCTRYPKKGGICKAHGAKVSRPLCQIEGCTNLEANKGVCIRHGAKVKRCSVENCEKQALKGGVCWSHGAKDTKVKKRCSVENCEKYASKGGVCARHGAKQCSSEGCTNQAKQNGVCIKHGATVHRKLCSVGGCPNQAKIGGYCKRHNTLISNASKEGVVVVEAPPGKLGLTLVMNHIMGGANVTAVSDECPLKGQVDVGDRVLSIDEHVITQTADFGINSDKTRQFKVAVNNSVENVLLNEKSYLGERLKSNLSGFEVADMQSQILQLLKDKDEARAREESLKIQLQRANKKHEVLEAQMKDVKSRVKELKDETVTLKTSLAREKRRAKKCPKCAEKVDLKSPEGFI